MRLSRAALRLGGLARRQVCSFLGQSRKQTCIEIGLIRISIPFVSRLYNKQQQQQHRSLWFFVSSKPFPHMESSSNDDVMPEHIRLRWSCLLSRISDRFGILNHHVEIMSLTGRLALTGVPHRARPTLEQQMCPHLPANIALGENQHASWGKCSKCTQRIFYLPKTTTSPSGTDEFHLHELNKQVLLEKLGVKVRRVEDGPAVGPETIISSSVEGPQLLRRWSAAPSSEEPGQAESQRPWSSLCRACLRAFIPRRSIHQ
jgi:hypothetical protein